MPDVKAEYDYIIVGGGTAGCVLANRLSADAKTRVLLVEAGGDDRNFLFHWPAGFARMTKGIASWGWSTVPQKHMQDRVFWYTQAKVIGGGSSINAQVYTRGHRLDFDTWAQAGCTGWGYDDIVKYFKLHEDNDTFENDVHGKGGPIGVSQPRALLPIVEAFIEAAEQAGIPRCNDLSGATPEGMGVYQVTQRNGRRSSAVTGYLKPALSRPNLTVVMKALTKRVVVEQGRAIGVEIIENGRPRAIRATAEVIVSSGAIGSPRLLLLSGIGPAAHLKSVGVMPVHDLPGVGSNLQDHLDICALAECTGDHSFDKYGKSWWAALAGLQYLFTRDGPAASSLFNSGGFWYADKAAAHPDVQFHFGLGSGIEAGIAKLGNPGVTLNAAVMRPRSRGTVRLRSADIMDHPLIDPNFWADPIDRDLNFKALEWSRAILRQPALKPFILAERLPGEGVNGKNDLFDYACRMAKTDHHPSSACAMGVGSMSVVSPELKVHGIEGLRVADTSIQPTVISSNTNATAMMIAEKCAAMVLGKDKISSPVTTA
ncbi:MAG: GMC family oxidoreductase N-terminal domain-containing protein [Proteobacteria bacterium]|nr:GMC family oxidoreductase N-terminal domain-containing protein [Pseudomonadota bacterium]